MKKFLKILILLSILIFFTSCNRKKEKIYTFSGESPALVINNGKIIISKNEEIFDGGNLTLKDENSSNVKNYKTSFYVNDREQIILVNSIKSGHLKDNEDLGRVSSKPDGKFDWLDDPSNRLWFEINYVNDNGETISNIIELVVEEFPK